MLRAVSAQERFSAYITLLRLLTGARTPYLGTITFPLVLKYVDGHDHGI